MAEIVVGTGALYKRIYSEFRPGAPGAPARPGTPAIPAHWETRSQQVCVLFTGDPVAALRRLESMTGDPISFEDTYYSGTRLCTMDDVSVFVPEQAAQPPTPATPATPAQTIYDYQIGWNARARSLPTMHRDGSYSAIVTNNTVGGMLGLTVQDATGGYADMTNAFYVARGSVRIYEFGAEVQSLGSAPGATLKIRRAAGKVQYFVNDTKVREVDATVMAPTWLSAALYSGGDRIVSPMYVEEATASIGGTMHGFRGFITDTDYCTIGGTMQALTGGIEIGVENRIGGTMQAFTGYLGKDACIIGGNLQPLTGYIDASGLIPTFGMIGGVMHPMVGLIDVLSGSVMTIDATMQPLVGMVSDRPTGYIAGTMQALTGGLLGFEPGNAYLISDAQINGDIVAASELVAFINSSGIITGLMSVQVLHSALIASTSTIGLTMTTQAQIDVLMQSVARSIAGLLPPDQTGEAWVLNVGAGMTRYNGYDFNSFAKIGESYYGAKSDGIYRLEGVDDDGTAVPSSVNFGRIGFGSLNRKALPDVYIGMASSGKTYLRVTAEVTGSNGRPVESTFIYEARDSTEILKAHRYEPGKGLRASFYDLELVADGEVFDLHSIEFMPLDLKRRL